MWTQITFLNWPCNIIVTCMYSGHSSVSYTAELVESITYRRNTLLHFSRDNYLQNHWYPILNRQEGKYPVLHRIHFVRQCPHRRMTHPPSLFWICWRQQWFVGTQLSGEEEVYVMLVNRPIRKRFVAKIWLRFAGNRWRISRLIYNIL